MISTSTVRSRFRNALGTGTAAILAVAHASVASAAPPKCEQVFVKSLADSGVQEEFRVDRLTPAGLQPYRGWLEPRVLNRSFNSRDSGPPSQLFKVAIDARDPDTKLVQDLSLTELAAQIGSKDPLVVASLGGRLDSDRLVINVFEQTPGLYMNEVAHAPAIWTQSTGQIEILAPLDQRFEAIVRVGDLLLVEQRLRYDSQTGSSAPVRMGVLRLSTRTIENLREGSVMRVSSVERGAVVIARTRNSGGRDSFWFAALDEDGLRNGSDVPVYGGVFVAFLGLNPDLKSFAVVLDVNAGSDPGRNSAKQLERRLYSFETMQMVRKGLRWRVPWFPSNYADRAQIFWSNTALIFSQGDVIDVLGQQSVVRRFKPRRGYVFSEFFCS